MPIFEYKAVDASKSCERCRIGVEVIQNAREDPMRTCPRCGAAVARVFAPPHVRVKGGEGTPIERRLREYEREGMYSHAAELADKEAEKTSREDLKARALENYKKAGYKDL